MKFTSVDLVSVGQYWADVSGTVIALANERPEWPNASGEFVEDFRSLGAGQGAWRDDVLNNYPVSVGM